MKTKWKSRVLELQAEYFGKYSIASVHTLRQKTLSEKVRIKSYRVPPGSPSWRRVLRMLEGKR